MSNDDLYAYVYDWKSEMSSRAVKGDVSLSCFNSFIFIYIFRERERACIFYFFIFLAYYYFSHFLHHFFFIFHVLLVRNCDPNLAWESIQIYAYKLSKLGIEPDRMIVIPSCRGMLVDTDVTISFGWSVWLSASVSSNSCRSTRVSLDGRWFPARTSKNGERRGEEENPCTGRERSSDFSSSIVTSHRRWFFLSLIITLRHVIRFARLSRRFLSNAEWNSSGKSRSCSHTGPGTSCSKNDLEEWSYQAYTA